MHPKLREADAEQAKQTGGMIALIPDDVTAELLAVEGGEPIEDLHITLCYFGEDVTDIPSIEAVRLGGDVAYMSTGPLTCRAFAHATFNPDAPEGREPCAVYLIGDSHELANIHQFVGDAATALYGLEEMHAPWIPHVTAGYGLEAADLTFVGDIVFDRIAVEWAGESHVFNLG